MSYRLLKTYWIVRDFLVPRKTLRRKVYDLGNKGIRVLLTEGLGGVWWRIRQRLPGRVTSGSAGLSGLSAPGLYADFYRTMLANSGAPGNDFVPLAEHDFPAGMAPVKLIAFYLPQFHPIPENDEWWGRGFTEWTNVSKAVPQFAGHYQPRLPGELGYYDLREPSVQRRQVELARKYGIYGFCFYYYWFHGKRLLERPLDQFLAGPEIDFPFCLCWANENWTRRWDGRDQEVLIGQEHSEESDFAFIRDVEPLLRHKNYIRIHGRPLLVVYRTQILPNPNATAKRWREYCRDTGIGEPYLVAAQTFGFTDPREAGFDAAVEFPPHNYIVPDITKKVALLNPDFAGRVHHYLDIARKVTSGPEPPYPLFRNVFPGWDNEPRRPGSGLVYAFSTPADYGQWLSHAGRRTLRDPDPEKRLVFINAWNEWGEGAYLEPDRKYGYAYLNATAKALAGLRDSSSAGKRKILFVSHDAELGGGQSVLLNFLAWLRDRGNAEIKILCLDGGEWLPKFRRLGDTLILKELRSRIPEERIIPWLEKFCGGAPDLIFGNSVASGREYPLLHGLKAPILTNVQELEMSIQRYAGESMEDVLRYSVHFIACSNAVSENLQRRYNVDARDITTVYSSISTDPLVRPFTGEEKRRRRRELGLAENGFLVFGCGTGMPLRKGADLFIKVAGELGNRGAGNFHFYWIGDFEDPGDEKQSQEWRATLAEFHASGLAEKVTFMGRKRDRRKYFLAADVFLLSSREDPFPLVALEAAECGLPILCFAESGGMPEFVQDDAGFTVPFGDTSAMAEKITFLMNNGEIKEKMGLTARGRVLSGYTLETTATQMLAVCDRILRP